MGKTASSESEVQPAKKGMGIMGGNPVIYLDMVLAVNLVMDWLILWAVALCLRLPFSYMRITAGALIGALYAVALVLPSLGFLATFGIKILFSLVMIGVAFAWRSWQLYLRILGCFYLISFMAGGAVMGVAYLVKDAGAIATYNGVMALINFPAGWLLTGIGILVLISVIGASAYRKHFQKFQYSVPLTVCFEESTVAARALVDTGNHLRDPFSQSPVVIMEYGVLKPFLPAELNCVLQAAKGKGLEGLGNVLRGTPWETRIRMLPFHSLGNRQGLLPGLVADQVYVEVDDTTVCHRKVVIGIYQGLLSPDRQYQALLHPELLQTHVTTGKGVA
jgi:stage II sporulation protein GA (sporulation sigma-E factor processing peptidase)